MGRSIIQTQRRFRNHFNVGRHGRVPKFETIMKWVNNFQRTGSLRPGTARGNRTVRTPENVERVGQAVEASPRRSAVKHARALRMSDRSVESVTLACVYLHNFLRRDAISRSNYTPLGTFDTEDIEGKSVIPGSWRADITEEMVGLQVLPRKPLKSATTIREEFRIFFYSVEGAVPWQNGYA
uniref:DUF4817 domain-containing protein n=1 Tax=Clastoptera arizonana TaxID=38151 RepID=A0A1B6DRD2_9HEMI